MTAGDAWIKLTQSPDIGVKTGAIKCVMVNDRLVECEVNERESVTLNHSQFLLEFSGRTFTECKA